MAKNTFVAEVPFNVKSSTYILFSYEDKDIGRFPNLH